ncbi:MAG TPA: hypothetical protein VF071_02630 [Candidatus Limnocylindria bacterium]
MRTLRVDGARLTGNRRVPAAALGLALVFALGLTGSTAAGRVNSVDPAFMTPALNPTFDWECWGAGDQIVCEGTATESWSGVEIGLCDDGGALYSTGFDSRRIRRVSDAEGRALTSQLFVQARDTVSRSLTMDGTVAKGMAQFYVSFEWGVPGDQSTRTSILHGMDASVTVPGHGLLLHQVGVISYDIDDNLLFARGVHPIVDDADAAFEQLFTQACDALADD